MMLHGLRPVIAGIVLGLGLAVGLSRFLKSLLFEVEPTDPATYGFVTVALMIAAFAASYIPARRASRVDPVEVLRVQ
jgi:ABC-type lipoprotein release transport system permease subunit